MELVGNSMNGNYMPALIKSADCDALSEIRLAVAYVTKMDDLFGLADKRKVPLTLYALGDGDFPAITILKRFVESSRPQWRLYLSRDFYHPKVIWLRGVGAYIGSANLTDNGMMSNLECGVWLDQNDLLERDWETALDSMFNVIHKRSTAASREHITAFEALRAETNKLDQARAALKKKGDELLRSIAGQDRPADPTAGKGGGAARDLFVQQWHAGLTVLRKMTTMMGEYPLPAWVRDDAPRSIVQDQATEGWYRDDIRFGKQGDDDGNTHSRIEELHKRNERDPETATRAVLKRWAESADPDRFARWVNENPAEVRQLLANGRIDSLTAADLGRVLNLTHSAREHGRQMRKSELGLDPDATTPEEERVNVWAKLLLQSRSASGKTIHDLLQFALWGDDKERDVAQRIWRAARDPEMSLRHIGINILGEMVGYARPDEYPPRNGRVTKTLYALGYKGV